MPTRHQTPKPNVQPAWARALALGGFGVVWAGAALAASPALVTPVWLRAHLHDPGLVVLEIYDTSAQAPDFAAGHVPGAAFTGFVNDGWRTTVNGVPAMPSPAAIAKVIGGFGIGPDSQVVLVTGGTARGDFSATTRIFWGLRVEGIANVAILNGGQVAWAASGAPVALGAPKAPRPAAFTPQPAPGLTATLADVRADLTSHTAILVDARPPAKLEGLSLSPVVKAPGTLPGALNLPFTALETADGEGVLPPAQLRAALAKAGVPASGPAITFCNTGLLGSVDWFVLRAVLGNPRVTLFSGSMAEWTADPARPVVAGKSAF